MGWDRLQQAGSELFKCKKNQVYNHSYTNHSFISNYNTKNVYPLIIVVICCSIKKRVISSLFSKSIVFSLFCIFTVFHNQNCHPLLPFVKKSTSVSLFLVPYHPFSKTRVTLFSVGLPHKEKTKVSF